MSYVDEIYERVVAQNPGEPEFHQAVKEVLDSLMVVCYFSLYCTIFSFLFLSCIPKASVIIYIAYKRGKFRGGNGYDSRAPFNYARTEYL